MLPVSKEGEHQPQTYRYSFEVGSLSLGQGEGRITPEPPFGLTQALDWLDVHPNDKWMWLVPLHQVNPEDIPQLVTRIKTKPSPALLRVLFPYFGREQFPEVDEVVPHLGQEEITRLFYGMPDLGSRAQIMNASYLGIEPAWDRVRRLNREQLVSLREMGTLRLPMPKNYLSQPDSKPTIPLQAIKGIYDREIANSEDARSQNAGTSLRDINLSDTVAKVKENPELRRVTKGQTIIGRLFCGTYVIAVPCNVDWRVDLDRANYHVIGASGASGKGLTKEATVASGFMELAERISAIAGATPNWPDGYKFIDCIRRATHSELQSVGLSAINPNDFFPTVPYQDQAIYWIQGQLLPPVNQGDPRGIWVPAQKAFHFSNLDEPEVTMDSSNGLASGNTPEEARLHALLEILERDGCYTLFTSPQRQFTLPPDVTDQIGSIIAAYHSKGLKPAFVDITTDFGVPAYKAYIQLPDGYILSGSGAHLNGRIALNRAICELGAKCSGVMNHGIESASREQQVHERSFSDIPDLSSGNVRTDLGLVETVFRLNGYPIIYADLTRSDVNIPVVRAIVPELDYPLVLTRREVKHFIEEYQGE